MALRSIAIVDCLVPLEGSEAGVAEEIPYVLAGAQFEDELGRLRLIEEGFDRFTTRHLDGLGVGAGWRCVEAGAGAGSIVRWLSDRVGPSGKVVGVDVDPRFLEEQTLDNVEIRRADITKDRLEDDTYDLIHCRFLLMHMGDPVAVLRLLAAALQPGGWILAEEPDNDVVVALDDTHPLARSFTDAYRKRVRFVGEAGVMDMVLGRSLPRLMAEVGLIEVGCEGATRLARGGEPMSRMWLNTWKHIDDRLLAEGVLTEAEVADTRCAYEDPTFSYRNVMLVSSWGRRSA
jgi:SAM-dependent methyltransferase